LELPPLQDPLLAYLVNLTMRHGKKTLYQNQIALMLRTILLTTSSPPLPLLRRALQMAAPSVGIFTIKRNMRKFEVPQPMTEKRRVREAWMWIVEESEKRLEKELGRRLAAEVLNVLEGKSAVLGKTMERHKVAVANRVN
ncbi:ribosomal protein S7, partial [Atractiella rhizophila]